MDTIYIQPIFAPDKLRFDRNWESLTSFFNYCEKYNYDIKFAIGGWCLDEYWDKFVTLINTSHLKNKITLLRFEKNYGKATTVNKLYEKVKEKKVDFKYILTADSDIVFTTETKNMVERLEKVAAKSVEYRKVPFGMCGLQQLGQGCHFTSIHENKYSFKNMFGEDENVVYPTNASGIAGGCLFVGREYWEKIGGYKVYGIYGPDDAYLLVGCAQLGYSWQVSDNIGIIHPHEDDAEYAKFKVATCQRMAGEGVKANIDKDISDMENFWKSHKINK